MVMSNIFSGKYDRDCAKKLRAVLEILDSIIGLVFISGGLMVLWFIGCALS